MKNIFVLLFVGLFSVISFSQDTLVTDKGFLIPGNIVSQDNDFIAYSLLDTSVKELALIARTNVIFIKYQNGKTEQLYVSDTLITKEGLFITCKVLEIDASTLTYFAFRDKFTNPSVMMKSNLLLIKLHDGSNVLADQVSGMSDTDYQNLGASDANAYYKVKPEVIVSEIILGAGTIFVAPILAGTLIAYIKPTKLENAINPNNDFLISNPHYKKGYQNKAAKKKIFAATMSYFGGIAGFIGGVIIAIQIY
jgi:hypothetical protein